MYLTIRQQLKRLSKEEFLILRELCHTAKNLTNQAIFNVRQQYFEQGRYLPYVKNYALLKSSENYKLLNSNMAQQILKEVDGSFRSFFSLLKLAKQGNYPFQACKLPKYLEKPLFWTDGKDCRHSNVDKLDKRCYNLVTIFPRECLHV